MNVEWLHSLYTVLAFATFVVIALWAWSARNRPDFDEAARLPLLDDEGAARNLVAAGKGKT